MSFQPSHDVVSRVRWHAGLDPGPGAVPSIADCTGPASTNDGIDAALSDLLRTLGELNQELNGEIPSSSTGGASQIPRTLCYAISEITRMLREHPGSHDAAWAVETAWAAILAGDVDSLDEHLRHESGA
jgi:hypothetical protein